MAAATSTTITTVKRRIVTVLTSALSTSALDGGQLPVFYAWPGRDTPAECVFLGPHPETADIRLDQSSEVPTIKAGRQSNREEYTVPVTVWTFRPDLSPRDAETCEVRAETIAALVYDEFVDDPRIGLAVDFVQHCLVTANEVTLFPFESGWACEWRVIVTVTARLR